MTSSPDLGATSRMLVARRLGWLALGVLCLVLGHGGRASAQTTTVAPIEPIAPVNPVAPVAPVAPAPTAAAASGTATTVPTTDPGRITIDLGSGSKGTPSQSVLVIVGLSLLSIAPSILIMMTSFTRIVIVLTLTRNALGVQGVPPNQVLVGLALFLSLFIMAPTLSEMNKVGLQPLLKGDITQEQAWDRASAPLKDFMLANTRSSELSVMLHARGETKTYADVHDVPLPTLIPAFILSELKTAFIIGFVIFIPFLVIDLVVSAVLMALGMMMLPPVSISLPFKLLLFVMVGGWSLVVETLLRAY